jgi:catalase
VKYWWISHQGVTSLETDEEVKQITNPAHATLDLFTSIQAGDYPSWTMQAQILDPADYDKVFQSLFFSTPLSYFTRSLILIYWIPPKFGHLMWFLPLMLEF